MLEENHAHHKYGMFQFTCPRRITHSGSGPGRLPSSFKFSDRQYLNILQSVGQSVHVINPNDRIIYWNRSAESLFGYSAEEALGQVSIKLVVDSLDSGAANNVVHRVNLGERWTGMFPVKKKSGEKFTILVTNNPIYDDAGILIGAVCTCMDAQLFHDMRVPMSAEKQPQQDISFSSRGASVAMKLVAKVTNKVKSRIQIREENMEPHGGSRGSHQSVFSCRRTSTPTGDVPPLTPFDVFNRNVRESSRIPSKGKSWPWKGNERDGSQDRATGLLWPWFHHDHVNVSVPEKYCCGTKPEMQMNKSNLSAKNKVPESCTSALDM